MSTTLNWEARELTGDDVSELSAQMIAWAQACYPNECCGLVVQTAAGQLEAIECENLQDKLHVLDCANYPRTARTAYSLDSRILLTVADNGSVLRAIFHSHPDRGAYFSEEDTLMALGGDPNGEPAFPGVDYIVLSARADGVDDVRLFRWNSVRRAFEAR
ncbi:MAG: proteasome lid subunit RPN8/RPN11 [Myxococcota bacterium]|jgi:proteasome lid subunit RPN8/RPN11